MQLWWEAPSFAHPAPVLPETAAGKELQVPGNLVKEDCGRELALSLVPLSPLATFPVSTLPLFHFNPTAPFFFFSSPYLSLFPSSFSSCALPISTFPFSIFPSSHFPHYPSLHFPIPPLPISPCPFSPSPFSSLYFPLCPFPTPHAHTGTAQTPSVSTVTGSPQSHIQPQAEPQPHSHHRYGFLSPYHFPTA